MVKIEETMKIEHDGNIIRIIYYWERYHGTRDKSPEGKTYSQADQNILLNRIKDYTNNPDKFDWDKGIVPEEE